MHPGIWRMIKTSLENEFRSDNHPFFIDQVQSVITVSSVQFNNTIIVLQTRLETESTQYHYTDRAKCYTMEMIEFLQDHCFGSMFGVGAQLPIPSPPDEDDNEIYNMRPVLHGTRVNITTYMQPAAQYGGPMRAFRRAGVDGLTLLCERHNTQLVLNL
jgi:hypothetical protein